MIIKEQNRRKKVKNLGYFSNFLNFLLDFVEVVQDSAR